MLARKSRSSCEGYQRPQSSKFQNPVCGEYGGDVVVQPEMVESCLRENQIHQKMNAWNGLPLHTGCGVQSDAALDLSDLTTEGHIFASRICPDPSLSVSLEEINVPIDSTPSKLAALRTPTPKGRDRLELLRERIREQQQQLNREQRRGEEGERRPCSTKEPSDHLKPSSSIIVSPKIRKVAAAPKAPVYKGFSSVETRIQAPDGKVYREKDFVNLDVACTAGKKPEHGNAVMLGSVDSTFSERGQQPVRTKPVRTKPVRKVCKLSGSTISGSGPTTIASVVTTQAKEPVTSTSRWRDGQRLARAILGPAPKQGSLTQLASLAPHHQPDAGKPTLKISPPGSKRKAEERETSTEQSSSGKRERRCRSHEPGNHSSSLARPTGTKQHLKCPLSPKCKTEDQQQQNEPRPRSRSYDKAAVKRYMERRLQQRRREAAEEREGQRHAVEAQRQRLHDLYTRQRQAVAKEANTERKSMVEAAVSTVLPNIGGREKLSLKVKAKAPFQASIQHLSPTDSISTLASSVDSSGAAMFLGNLLGTSAPTSPSSSRPSTMDVSSTMSELPVQDTVPVLPTAPESFSQAEDLASSFSEPEKVSSRGIQIQNHKGTDHIDAQQLASYRDKLARIRSIKVAAEILADRIESDTKKLGRIGFGPGCTTATIDCTSVDCGFKTNRAAEPTAPNMVLEAHKACSRLAVVNFENIVVPHVEDLTTQETPAFVDSFGLSEFQGYSHLSHEDLPGAGPSQPVPCRSPGCNIASDAVAAVTSESADPQHYHVPSGLPSEPFNLNLTEGLHMEVNSGASYISEDRSDSSISEGTLLSEGELEDVDCLATASSPTASAIERREAWNTQVLLSRVEKPDVFKSDALPGSLCPRKRPVASANWPCPNSTSLLPTLKKPVDVWQEVRQGSPNSVIEIFSRRHLQNGTGFYFAPSTIECEAQSSTKTGKSTATTPQYNDTFASASFDAPQSSHRPSVSLADAATASSSYQIEAIVSLPSAPHASSSLSVPMSVKLSREQSPFPGSPDFAATGSSQSSQDEGVKAKSTNGSRSSTREEPMISDADTLQELHSHSLDSPQGRSVQVSSQDQQTGEQSDLEGETTSNRNENTMKSDEYCATNINSSWTHIAHIPGLSAEDRRQKSPSGPDQSQSVSRLLEVSVGANAVPPELSMAHHQKHTSFSKNPPWALAQRLAVELSYLQSLDHASLMLSSVEKSRAVGRAQMEAVTLAQHLRARQEQHERDLAQLRLEGEIESIEAKKELLKEQREADSETGFAWCLGTSRNADEMLDRRGEAESFSDGANHLQSEPAKQEAFADGEVSWRNGLHQNTDCREKNDVTTLYKKEEIIMKRSTMPTLEEDESLHLSHPSGSPFQSPNWLDSPSPESICSNRSLEDSRSTTLTPASQVGLQTSPNNPQSNGSLFEEVPAMADNSDVAELDRTRGSQNADNKSCVAGGSTEASEVSEHLQMVDDAIKKDSSSRPLKIRHRRQIPAGKGTTQDPSSAENSGIASKLSYSQRKASIATRHNTPVAAVPSLEVLRHRVRDEELRAQHQDALLQFREKALREKTSAELAWLKHQKRILQQAGDLGQLLILNQKQQNLRVRLQQEQAEIRGLREAARAASEERRLMLRQQKDIMRLQRETQQLQGRLRVATIRSKEIGSLEGTVRESLGIEATSPSATSAGSCSPSPPSTADRHHRWLSKLGHKLDGRYLTRHEQNLLQKNPVGNLGTGAESSTSSRNTRHAKGEDSDNLVSNLDSCGAMKASDGSSVVEELESAVISRSFSDVGNAEQSLKMMAIHDMVGEPSKSAKTMIKPSKAFLCRSNDIGTNSHSAPHSEVLSDQSDIEGRVHALEAELHSRRQVAERLRREQQRRHIEKLHAREESLSKQLEAYDKFISRAQAELNSDLDVVRGTKPKIKTPSSQTRLMSDRDQSSHSASKIDTESERLSTNLGSSFETGPQAPKQDHPVSNEALSQLSVSSPSEGSFASTVEEELESFHYLKDSSTQDGSQVSLAFRNPHNFVISADASFFKMEKKDLNDLTVDSHYPMHEVTECSPKDSPYHLKQSVHSQASDNVTGKGFLKLDNCEDDIEAAETCLDVTSPNSSFQGNHQQHLLLRQSSIDTWGNLFDEISRQVLSHCVDMENEKAIGLQPDTSDPSIKQSLLESTPEMNKETSGYLDLRADADIRKDSRKEEQDNSEDDKKNTLHYDKERKKSVQVRQEGGFQEGLHEEYQNARKDEDIKNAEHQYETKDDAVKLKNKQGSDNMENLPISSHLLCQSPNVGEILPGFCMNDRVLVSGEYIGTLRFVGFTRFDPGVWVGVELDKHEGNGNGSYAGVRYFSCPDGHGVFVLPERIEHLLQTNANLDQVRVMVSQTGTVGVEPVNFQATEPSSCIKVSSIQQKSPLEEHVAEGFLDDDRVLDFPCIQGQEKVSSGFPLCYNYKQSIEDESLLDAPSIASGVSTAELDRIISESAQAVEMFAAEGPIPGPVHCAFNIVDFKQDVVGTHKSTEDIFGSSFPLGMQIDMMDVCEQAIRIAEQREELAGNIADDLTTAAVRDAICAMNSICKPKLMSNVESASISFEKHTPMLKSLMSHISTQKHPQLCEAADIGEIWKERCGSNLNSFVDSLVDDILDETICTFQEMRGFWEKCIDENDLLKCRDGRRPITLKTKSSQLCRRTEDLVRLSASLAFLSGEEGECCHDHAERPASPVFGARPVDEAVARIKYNTHEVPEEVESEDEAGELEEEEVALEMEELKRNEEEEDEEEDGIEEVWLSPRKRPSRDWGAFIHHDEHSQIQLCVPHTADEVLQLVTAALLQSGQCETPSQQPVCESPVEEGATDSEGSSSECRTKVDEKRAYKKLVFDLTTHAVSMLTNSSAPLPVSTWSRWQSPHCYSRGFDQEIGQFNDFKEHVEMSVVNMLGLGPGGRKPISRSLRAYRFRKSKQDRVDTILELAKEERSWVDYEYEELQVKEQLADSIFETLLQDTVTEVERMWERRVSGHVKSA
uniref:centrosome-associated protein 350-like isoform X2 n=1 Tax=Myxine glutinosa TaxID=7769 RepID=UPI00358E67D8